MVDRYLYEQLIKNIQKQKVQILFGARRVGKTNLLKRIESEYGSKCFTLNGEDEIAENLLAERSISNYKRILAGYELLIIDEAQYLKDIGRKLKLMIDEIHPLHIIISGSSAFDIEQASEPLVGRTISHRMYPVAQAELKQQENLLQTNQNLDERLLYGSYPETLSFTLPSEKEEYLRELVNTYLLKDILAFENIRNPQKIKDLLVLLAYQVGNEVSPDELGRKLGISKNTVERYLDLASKIFVIYKRRGYSKNLRKEVTKSSKWYFYDNGIRNGLIGDFRHLSIREDTGMLWENYITAERIKFNAYTGKDVNSYFWRTYDQQEIDLIEETVGNLEAYEFKWSAEKVKLPVAFSGAYPEASYKLINKKNYLPFIT